MPSGGGWLLTSADGTGYTYDGDGRLTGSRTPDGIAWSVAWNGDTQTVTTSAGATLSLVEHDGLLRTVILPDERQVTYGYDDGRLTSVTDAAGAVTSYAYDETGRMTQLTDATGQAQFTNTYGADGRIESQSDATGDVTWFYWDEEQQVSYVWGPNGDQWTYAYRGPVLMWFEQPDAVETSYVYDGSLNVVAKTQSNKTDTFAYDQVGNPIAAEWSDGTSLQLQYDSTGHPLTVTDASGTTTSYVYDARGHLLETHLADGRVAVNQWDPITGDQTASVTPAGRSTSYEHNAAGQLTAVVTSEGRRTSFRYDVLGRLTSFITPHADGADDADYTWTVTYTSDGLTAVAIDPLGQERQIASTILGQLSETTDARGNSTGYSYTPNQQLSSVMDTEGGQTSYAYDANGWMSSRQDQNGNVEYFQNDALGRVTGVQLPDGSTWNYGYSKGRLTSIQDPNAAANSTAGTTSLSYDSLGRLVNANPSTPTTGGGGPIWSRATADGDDDPAAYLPSAAAPVDVQRDQAGRVQLLALWNADQGQDVDSVAYTWDTTGRLTGVVRDGRTVAYQWDDDDRLTAITDDSGVTTTRTYTDDGLLASVTVDGATVSYQYDVPGNLVSTQYPDGTREERDHDLLARTTRVTTLEGDTMLHDATYEYDAVGNPVHIVRDGVEHYARYDAKNELTDWCTQTPCTPQASGIHYTYDPTGNRLTETRDGDTTTYVYDSNNRLTTVTAPDGATRQMNYDTAGRLIGDNDRSYQYDVLGRLTSVTDPTVGTITYTYTADGLLDTRTANGATTGYQWDTTSGVPRLLSESNGESTMAYAYGEGIVRAAQDSDVAWVHTDTVGSSTSLTVDGDTVASVAYEPFGQTASSDLPDLPFTLPGFAGTPTDPDTGLLLMGARVYDPSTGRFLTFDPDSFDVDEPAISTYVYVSNRPTVLADPTGRHGVSVRQCPGWLCVLYDVNEYAGHVATTAGLGAATLGVVGVLTADPLAVGAADVFEGVSAVSEVGEIGTGLIITVYDVRNGGDPVCEATNTAAGAASWLVGRNAARAMEDWGSVQRYQTQSEREAWLRISQQTASGGASQFMEGLAGTCERP